MHTQSLVKIHWCLLPSCHPTNENMGVSRADNSIKIWWNLPISNPKPDHNINAHTKFWWKPLKFTQVIIRKWNTGRRTDTRTSKYPATIVWRDIIRTNNQTRNNMPHQFLFKVWGIKKNSCTMSYMHNKYPLLLQKCDLMLCLSCDSSHITGSNNIEMSMRCATAHQICYCSNNVFLLSKYLKNQPINHCHNIFFPEKIRPDISCILNFTTLG